MKKLLKTLFFYFSKSDQVSEGTGERKLLKGVLKENNVQLGIPKQRQATLHAVL